MTLNIGYAEYHCGNEGKKTFEKKLEKKGKYII